MIVLVCGGRKFATASSKEKQLLYQSMSKLKLEPLLDLVMEGGAWGADYLAGLWADAYGIPHLRIPADWSKGKSAGILRNLRMVDFMGLKPDLVVAFPGGDGTAHMIRTAVASNLSLWLPQQHAEPPSQWTDLLRTRQDTTSQERSSRLPSAETNAAN